MAKKMGTMDTGEQLAVLALHNVLPFYWGRVAMCFLTWCPRLPAVALDLFLCVALNSPLQNQKHPGSKGEKL